MVRQISTKRKKTSLFITVFGKDQPGIIAAITGVLFREKCNLEDIEMSILEGQFAMMMIASAPKSSRINSVGEALKITGKKLSLSIQCAPITQHLKKGERHDSSATAYFVTAIGPDKTGIVHSLSRLFADIRGNITGFHSRLVGTEKKPLFSLMLEVDVPSKYSPLTLQEKIRRVSQKLNLEIHLKPQSSVTL